MPDIIARDQHPISRSRISEPALKVLYRLKNADHAAYLVGGSVRDLLLGKEPKDFDIATDAKPEEVKQLFRNSRLIGRRFRLAHVRFGRDIIEVATFRGSGTAVTNETPHHVTDSSGMILRDNLYGTLEEDAFRRDFTINALYYNIADFSVVDHVNGLRDLEDGYIRLIGDPMTRYREDPVRMLRAVRFAVKLGFRIHPDSETPISNLADTLADIPPARLFEEFLKMFLHGQAHETFSMLRHYGLFAWLFPQTETLLVDAAEDEPLSFIGLALDDTDARVNADKPITPAFLLAALLWEPVRHAYEAQLEAGVAPHDAMPAALSAVLEKQQSVISIPKRFSMVMREIFVLQVRMTATQGKRVKRVLAHPRFRAAYDFLVLRSKAGEVEKDLADFWTQAQEGHPQGVPSKKRRRRRRPRNAAGDDA